MQPIGNLPSNEPLRWSLNKAARELDCTEYLLAKRLKDAGETADSGNCWSTSQLIKAMFGSLHFERLRRTRAEADGRELQNAILRAEYLPRLELQAVFTELADAMQQIVRASKLDRSEQDDFLRNLAAIPIRIKTAAGRQAKQFAGGRNGADPDRTGSKPKSPRQKKPG